MSDDIELSPGFFDLNNPNNDNDLAEISNLIPDKINVEKPQNKNNSAVEFFTLMVFNTTATGDKQCSCDGSGWSRKSTY